MSNREFNAQKLFDIACILKVQYDLQQVFYEDFLAEPDNDFKHQEWQDTVKDYHKALIRHAGAIAHAMCINSAFVKMLMGVRNGVIVWTPDMLRECANYERMNPNYRALPSAVKKHNFEFGRVICP